MNDATSSATAVRISSAIGPPSRRRAPPAAIDQARAGAGMGSRGRPLPTASRVSEARRSTSWSSASTRAVMISSNSGSPTDGRLTSTFAAAPCAAASPRSEATLRSLDALTLLRPASASAARDQVDAGLDADERDLARVPGGGLERLGTDRALLVRVARQLHRGAVVGVGGGVLVGKGEELVRQAHGPCRWPRSGGRRAARTSGVPSRARRPSRPAPPRDPPPPPRRSPHPGPARPNRARR